MKGFLGGTEGVMEVEGFISSSPSRVTGTIYVAPPLPPQEKAWKIDDQGETLLYSDHRPNTLRRIAVYVLLGWKWLPNKKETK